ncbi:50S ribosomal protein L25 [Candidatus Kaiserbacteria bacterium]|nr:50S ribosomal protein L25 [Candidatus Kaiserbacteria bacterium]
MTLSLATKIRDAKERADAVRARGAIPAVVYGHKEPSAAIEVDAAEMKRVWRAAGETTIISLQGAGAAKDTLVRDVQFHPVTGEIMHIDFYALEKGKKVEITVPLKFVGVSPAEKAGCVLAKALHDIEIKVDPSEMPHDLSVDVSSLAADGDHILASQIVLPKSATLVTDPEEIVVSAVAAEEEPAEAPAVAEAAEAPAAAAEA